MNILRRLLKRQKVAAVMIVKNEEARLPRCLKSLKGHVGQVIISDTGSTDDSVKIAKSFGATVIPGKWIDDFSEARNQAFIIAAEMGVRWAFIIDADEWLEPTANLLDLADTTGAESMFQFPLRNQLLWNQVNGEPGFGWTWQPRFIRMAALPFYSRGIHNKIGCLRTKAWDRKPEYVIKHDGYAKSPAEINQKLATRLPVADRLIQQGGKETASLLFDKVRYLARGDLNEEATKVMKQAEAEFAKHGEYTIAMANMEGNLANQRGDFKGTIRMLYRAHELNPNYMDAEFHLAYIWMKKKDPNFKYATRYLESHKRRCDAFWKAPELWFCNEELVTVDANPLGWKMMEQAKKAVGKNA